MLAVASSEPHVLLTLRRSGGDAYAAAEYTGRSSHVWVHVVLNNISNSFLTKNFSVKNRLDNDEFSSLMKNAE